MTRDDYTRRIMRQYKNQLAAARKAAREGNQLALAKHSLKATQLFEILIRR